jgi:hypothetical protein
MKRTLLTLLPFAVIVAYFLLGLLGHYIKMTYIQPQ